MSPAYAQTSTPTLSNLISNWNGQIPNLNVNVTADAIASSLESNATAINHLASEGGNISHSIRQSSSEMSNTLRGFQDPKTVFKMGLASGFGFSLGSMLVQFATDGATTLVKKVFYEVSGQMDPSAREKMTGRGKMAWDELEKQSMRVLEIDKNIQLRLAVLSELSGKDPLVMANILDDRRRVMESDIENLKDFMKSSRDDSVRMECSSAIRQMQSQIELLKQMQPILRTEQPRSQADLCAGFDRLYAEWANVELQMHNSRSALLQDMIVLATGAEKEAQNAGESIASERKIKNECKNSKLDSVRELISSTNCNCESQMISKSCNYLCLEKSNYEAHEKSCLNMVAMSTQVDSQADSLVRSELVRQNTAMLEASYRKLAKSYCAAGEKSQVCDGEAGSFTAIHERMQNQFEQIKNVCGADSIVSTSSANDILVGKRKATAIAASEKPIASADATALPKPAEGGGFISQITGFFKKLF